MVYRNEEGIWSFHEGPGSVAVEAELAHGHHVSDGGQPSVVGPSGDLGMSAEQAVRAGLLMIPIIQKKK